MKLVYFSGRGRAEVARLIFAAGGVNYDNKRIDFNEWSDIKPSERSLGVVDLDLFYDLTLLIRSIKRR